MNKEELKTEKEFQQLKHKLVMERLEYERETNRIYHERELERGRIKNAEYRKNIELKMRSLK